MKSTQVIPVNTSTHDVHWKKWFVQVTWSSSYHGFFIKAKRTLQSGKTAIVFNRLHISWNWNILYRVTIHIVLTLTLDLWKWQVSKLWTLFFSLQKLHTRDESTSAFTAGKTGYNRHFPRSFLLNFGTVLQNPSDQAILSRLRDFNCEWL